nr:Ig-like domain-containing protein [Candidatus Woesebacteria bacterium]
GYVLFTGPLSTFTHAVVPLSASDTESSIYAYPLTIQADGSSESKIDIFVSSDSSLPLADKKVDISTTMGSIAPTTAMTDKLGHVSYTLTMSEPGVATISFMVNGQQFSKQVTVQGE